MQTHEEASVYVKELDIFLTLKVLENTLAVLSVGKLCDENGYSIEWINGQKPHLTTNGIRILCNTENFVPIVVPARLVKFVFRIYIDFKDIFETGFDTSPVPVSTSVDDRSGQRDETQANKSQHQIKRKPREDGETRCLPTE